MKPKQHSFSSLALPVAAAAGFLTQSALADYVWTGTAGNGLYSDASNWSGTNTDNNLIDNGQTATVDSAIGWHPNDLKIAAAGGSLTNTTTGTVTISAGSLSTNYWTFVGDWAGNATMNVSGSGSYTSGALNGNGNIHVGLYGSTGVLNVNTTGTVTASGLYVAPNNVTNGGALPNSGGTFNLAAGTVNISGDTQIGSDFWGAGNFSNGKINMTGGTMNVGGLFEVGHLGLSVSTGTSTATISGGTLNVENDLRLGFAGNSGTTASMIINGGTVNVATSSTRWVILGQYDPTALNMQVSNGGSLNLSAGTDIMFGINGNSGARTLTVDGGTINGTSGGGTYIDMQRGTTAGTSTITIKNGGMVSVDAVVGGAVSTLNFDGGTLKATTSDANFINLGAGVTNILSGGATLDTNGFNSTVVSAMGGAGGLTKNGSGKLTLSGTNTYSGTTTVHAGSLGGTGTIAGPVVIQSGAGFDFVNTSSSGTLTLQNGLALSDANLLTFEVGGGSSDKIAITGGSYTAPTSPADVEVHVVGGLGLGVRKLITGASGINAADFNLITSPPTGYDFALQVTGNDLELVITSVSPATAYWKGGVDGSWNSPDGVGFNWVQDDSGGSSTVTKPGTPTDVVFSATGAAHETTTLNEDFTINSLTFDASAGNVTIGASGIEELTITGGIANHSSNAQAINVPLNLTAAQTIDAATAGITLGSSVIASAELTKTGAGTLTLADALYGSAGVRVNGGALDSTVLLAASSLNIASGSSTGTMNVSSGTVNIAGVTSVGAGGAGTDTQSGTLNMSGGTWNNENDLTVGGTGATGASGILNLSGGTLNVASSNLRWVKLGEWGTSANSQLNVTATGVLHMNAGTNIQFRGSAGTHVLNVDGGKIEGQFTGADYYMWMGIGTVNVKNGGQITNWGRIDLGTGTLNLESNGSIQALAGVDAWEGWVNIKSGAVLQTAWLASGTPTTGGSVTIDNGTIRATVDNATFFNFWNNAAGVTIGAGGATIDTNGFNIAGNKGFAGSGNLTKTGTGTLTMGANTYTGNTTVNAGTLAVNGSSLADASALVINAGAVVAPTGTEVVDALFFGAVQQSNGTWGATGSGAAHIDDVHFTGAGVVQVGPAAGYSSWATLNGAGSQTMDQDHDNDGMPNGIEYFIGGPNGNTTGFTANPAPNSGTITWPMGSGYTGVYGTDYEVQSSTDLVTWTLVPVGTGDNTVSVTPGTSVVYDMPAGGKSFVRLVVHN